MSKIWLANPEAHDFPAAIDYLELLMPLKEATALVEELKKVKTKNKKAKDILRASELPLLPKENIHVTANLEKFKNGKKLSPLLLVRSGGKLIIADGYHRICASYYLSEDLEVPCRIV
ncbi:hypothetical protein QWZ08_08965 [Ferruginibacter paludis]|jgi:hypothetical protein|uniref:hypothetical protein n=1 Tax=Ferruginibacter paludis TaxID=1310417 RepID=UPI0025B4FED4|nr:hypothetical protein [Ferruginibacter paludis]MDN3655752.1 hypothetical protein [Ferruginibacter paludis]